MTDLAIAAAGAALGIGTPVDETFISNPSPRYALVTTFPQNRFETPVSGVFLMPRQELIADHSDGARVAQPRTAEVFDVLATGLSYEEAVAIGRQATSLVGDESPEIDLGSAL